MERSLVLFRITVARLGDWGQCDGALGFQAFAARRASGGVMAFWCDLYARQRFRLDHRLGESIAVRRVAYWVFGAGAMMRLSGAVHFGLSA